MKLNIHRSHKKSKGSHLIFSALLSLLFCLVFNKGALAMRAPDSFANLVENSSSAVVNISTTQEVKVHPFMNFKFHGMPEGDPYSMFKDFFDREFPEATKRKATSLGSGFIIDSQGYIVTNNHVIAEAQEISITLSDNPNKTYKAKLIGQDSKSDLAVLKIEAKKKLPFIKFGDSDAARVGDWVVTIGNPFGFGGTVTAGIISAKSRDIGNKTEFIQTDSSINMGNSGGPMFNMSGEVIGINTSIISGSGGNIGLGFAIPSNIAKPIIKQLKTKGKVTRGWLGVKIQPVNEDIANSFGLKETYGALVAEVVKDSPAQKGSIEVGDIIVEFNGHHISKMQKLPRLVAQTKIGKRVPVVVSRNGKMKDLSVVVEKSEDPEDLKRVSANSSDTDSKNYIMGMIFGDITSSERAKYKLDKTLHGVIIKSVKRGSVADSAGMRAGDVIQRFNQSQVKDAKNLITMIEKARKRKNKKAVILLSRDGSNYFQSIEIED